MSAPSIDPATLVDFQRITNAASFDFRCKACGSTYKSVTNVTFCPDCLARLY